jgi:cytochrome c553
MKKLIFAVLVSTFCFAGCYYDKDDVLNQYSTSACDTTVITYSQSIVPVISASCLGCHGGANASAGIRLDNYTGLKTMVNNGLLLKAVTHSPGASPMPKNGTKLNDCSIAKISKWIAAGAPQN